MGGRRPRTRNAEGAERGRVSPEMFSTPEAARIAGMTVSNVIYWDNAGVVPACRARSRRLYSYQDLVILCALRASGITRPSVQKQIAAALRASDLTQESITIRLSPAVECLIGLARIRETIRDFRSEREGRSAGA